MSDHEWRQVRVTFRKAVSDGNYGTESAEVTLEDYTNEIPDDGPDADFTLAEALLKDARALVHGELERSPSQRVRSAIDHSVQTGIWHSAGPDDDGEE